MEYHVCNWVKRSTGTVERTREALSREQRRANASDHRERSVSVSLFDVSEEIQRTGKSRGQSMRAMVKPLSITCICECNLHHVAAVEDFVSILCRE